MSQTKRGDLNLYSYLFAKMQHDRSFRAIPENSVLWKIIGLVQNEDPSLSGSDICRLGAKFYQEYLEHGGNDNQAMWENFRESERCKHLAIGKALFEQTVPNHLNCHKNPQIRPCQTETTVKSSLDHLEGHNIEHHICCQYLEILWKKQKREVIAVVSIQHKEHNLETHVYNLIQSTF
ncbi:hypothetical protein BGW36DRAFT_43766 [Talaromyces proteolyticus]|uniref:Uncharacterized protein n=1 Tax=Talaromyces proteolyticus TaxID=1131652 RepID=A0AAD4KN51_9EURO|nr:uncharacterized protein BGW36DRAFT_43766 [Talaromyces proteolyticus]KAH8692237.1 hypothetical protein BGW36DRAFT_43766 [Talaromyces proteolyticus]